MIPIGAARRMIVATANKYGVSERALLDRVRNKFNLSRVPLMVHDHRTGAKRRVGSNRPMMPGDTVLEWATDSQSLIEYISLNFDKIDLNSV